MDYTLTAIVTIVAISATVLVAIYLLPSPEEIKKADNTAVELVISPGNVEKYYNNGEYVYTYLYNLPITNPPFQLVTSDVDFNTPFETKEYKVHLGHTKDDLEYIGILTRIQDGYHKLTYKSDQNYHYSCITLGDTTVACSSF